MAVFGVQLILTMVMASVLSKLSTKYSLARWLISNKLVRYLHPTDSELRNVAGISKISNKTTNKGRGRHSREKNNSHHHQESESFLLPRSTHLQLEVTQVTPVDVLPLRFYTEYQWLMDFSACALLIYLLTDVYYFFLRANDEFNLSLLWCLLVIGFSFKILLSLTVLYFRGDEPIGERSLCLTAGLFFFLISMVVLIVDENLLEFGLQSAYTSFNVSAHRFLEDQGLTSAGPISQLMFKLSLAVWCGITGAFFIFPGMRFAKMHYDSLKYCEQQHFFKVILHTSFLSPLLLVLLWVKPVARDYLTERMWPGMEDTIMKGHTFDSMRLLAVVAVVAIRLLLMPHYLQAYLNLAPRRVQELNREAGRITNFELQKMVASVFYYLCVVALQYLAPLFMCLFSVFLLKNLGSYSWFGDSIAVDVFPMEDGDFVLKKVFNPILYRGILGFMTWWLCAIWFTTSGIGLIYHSYFSKE